MLLFQSTLFLGTGGPPSSSSVSLSIFSQGSSLHFLLFLFSPSPYVRFKSSTAGAFRPPHRDPQTSPDSHLLHHQQGRGPGRVSVKKFACNSQPQSLKCRIDIAGDLTPRAGEANRFFQRSNYCLLKVQACVKNIIVHFLQDAVMSHTLICVCFSLIRGRFGQVHKCMENSSGLTLAAKIIKARSQKEKEVVRNEIQVMNQLNHANLIQLYAAFESRHDIILVMEYVEGGELFDRIIDENYNLTELDTVLFIRQICEGLQYMHKMYILHLDLKPENILCVSRATNKIKIIDFGLARRYKPREKLRVNFGTPEFLAPEVINYEFVSFPTDMWSLGVITYMLLSGLSPFLGDDDNETLNNILACQWNFEEEEFTDISDEAKDFITRLLVKSKSWRMSAAESLRHPWLSDRSLHYRLLNDSRNLSFLTSDWVTKSASFP
uniref:Myosin light chain kinase family, member 4b n=1 Tax=Salarias fasciatus TaxID=181472 RepID=A0A672FH17_SALFA